MGFFADTQCLEIVSKLSHFYFFGIFHQFCCIEIDLSGKTVWPQILGFQKVAKLTILQLSTQNVNLARFARNVEWDFFCDFQTHWLYEDWRYTIRIAFLISFLKRALRERCQGLWQLRIRYVCLISIWLYVNDVGGFLVSITLLREVLWAYTWQLTFNGNGTDLTFDAQNSNEGM